MPPPQPPQFESEDKVSPGPKVREENVNAYLGEMLAGAWEEVPQYFVTSSSSGLGREELLGYIDGINSEVGQQGSF